MRKFFLPIALFLLTAIQRSNGQTVSGWDAAVTSQYGGRNYQLIGTYQGWDTAGIYIAGYNHYNNSNLATQRVYMGSLVASLQNGYIGFGSSTPRSLVDIWGGQLFVTGNDINGTALITSSNGIAYFSNNSISNGIAVASTGNVGIGTTNPATKLAVNGTITTKEVNVTTTGWPDYVFKPGYQLPSLEDLAAQIKAQGHLPNIPSAEEVNKNGIALGEMNKKLLEKVEELTLYIIEQDKKSKQQDEQIKAQNEASEQQKEQLRKQQEEINLLKEAVKKLGSASAK